MKHFIVLTTISGERVAIRPSDIIFMEECKKEKPMIRIKAEDIGWLISIERHSLESILKEIEDTNIQK